MNQRRMSRRMFGRGMVGLGLTGTALGRASASLTGPASPPDPLVFVSSEMKPKPSLILITDQQLLDLQDPDKPVDISLGATPRVVTLRQVCQQAKAGRGETVVLAFDAFWEQYRTGQKGNPRSLTPDSDEYVACLAKISKTLGSYGLGLELSFLTPLEIGAAYAKATGESGQWVQYREAYRDITTGRFSVTLWEQLHWTNNKGTVPLRRVGVQAYAFREQRVGQSRFYHVDPSHIVRLDRPVTIEEGGADGPRAGRRWLHVHGEGEHAVGPLDRVLVVVRYQTPEMDYFSDRALPYLKGLVDKYHQAGIALHGLYSDEVHIQQDWVYDAHHDEGQFAFRYLTPSLARRFAERYGAEFADLEKSLVYFTYAQHGFYPTLEARLPALHVLEPNANGIARTALLRRRYFDLLDRTVVDLFVAAKKHAEATYGRTLEATAHATWAESPTVDFWDAGGSRRAVNSIKYEYTPNFLWSNTVQQAAAACDDYFRWGEFLTGGGTDHAEGGWSDRDYYGLALACGLGVVNPNRAHAYAAGWGWPQEVGERYDALGAAYGTGGHPAFGVIAEGQHRDIEVLMLYPLSLVACEERFGSWMVQYGYANPVTPEVLLARGQVTPDGAIVLGGRRFTTLAVLFEPLPPAGLLPFLEKFVDRGGRLVWSGPPPRLDLEGQPALARWCDLVGTHDRGFDHEGRMAAGSLVEFSGQLGSVPTQAILTDFLVDLIYPVEPLEDVGVVARLAGRPVGLHRKRGRGTVTFLGFRPRDDQSASLGYESRSWFEVLKAVGAYPKSRPDVPSEDNPSVVSRESPYLATRFPNGAIALAAHYRSHVEAWPGGFHRDPAQDREALKRNPLPPDSIALRNMWVNGHRVTFSGHRVVAFRLDNSGHLLAFGGYQMKGIEIDGHAHQFADQPLEFLAFAPVPRPSRVPGGAGMMVWVHGQGEIRIPLPACRDPVRVFEQGSHYGSPGAEIPAQVQGDHLILQLGLTGQGARVLYVLTG